MRRCVEVNGKPVRECHYTCMHACIYRNMDRRITKKNIVSGSIYWMSRDIKTVSECGLAYKDTGSIPCI